ncbi:hypothetical protein JYU34_018785 [Plutella xylostella]|uniref:Reverse transcriptase domain-containing protein n=1 Tax=Plutella xylostella TaxID=51655 RepID=A0ABQ7PZY5_PLUXY|nr:hypothetical protein JYU34_018785 [Plutella xylostella]
MLPTRFSKRIKNKSGHGYPQMVQLKMKLTLFWFKLRKKPKIWNEVISTKFPSDHRLLRLSYNLDKHMKKKRSSYRHKNKNFSPIEEESLKNMIKEQIEILHNDSKINSTYTKTIEEIKKCVKHLPITKENSHKTEYITKDIEYLIDERNKLKQIPNRTIEQRKKLKKLYTKIPKKIKESRQRIKLESLEKEIKIRSSTKRSKIIFENSKDWIKSLHSNEIRKETTKRQEILTVATNFYKQLYSCHDNAYTEPKTNTRVNESVAIILNRETEFAIMQLKKDKCSGADGITNDTIIAMIEPLSPHLTKLFNNILIQEQIPEDWNNAIITLLYKKGDPNLIDNYRPICLLPTIYKLFSKIILNRLTQQLDEQQPREQAGFRKGFSTTDHIFTLTQVIEKYKEYNKDLYLEFVDYTKAFDSVSHSQLWESLKEQGIPTKYISILKAIYSKTSAQIRLEKIGDTFPIKRGVKQGDPISPKLFTALLESIFRIIHFECDKCGININGEMLTHLRFADDIVLLADSHDAIQTMLRTLDTESRKVGLLMNSSKTRAMTNSTEKPIHIHSGNIKYVNEYIYLGQIISFEEALEKEIDKRIATSWKKYWANKDVFKSDLPIHLKKKIMDNTILPTLLYGCQCWALTKTVIRKITTFQRATERSMLGLKLRDRVKNSDIREITKVTDAVVMLCKLKWKSAGHIARVTDGRWSERVLHWYPRDGHRMPGRPRRRWHDDIVSVAGHTWTRLAQNRKEWLDMEEAFTQFWVPK